MDSPAPAAAPPRGALDGVLVADFSRVLAGPLAAMMLADLGARVVKVERPGSGDDTRAWGPPYVGPMSTYFSSVNRNKESVTLDLTDTNDLTLARALAARADVLLENFLPGTMSRHGLDHASIAAANPGIVYCSISGFGASSELPGYDFLVQALGGLMSVTGDAAGAPTKVGTALVDVLTGLHATVGILAALREREATGRGQTVEVNLLSSLLASLVNQAAGYLNGAAVPQRMGNEHPSIAPYETIATQDVPLALAIGNDRQFGVLTRELGRPELAQDRRFATNAERVRHRAELVEIMRTMFGQDTAASWTRRLQAAGLACGPVNDVAEAIGLAQRLGLDPVTTFAAGDGHPAIATLSNPIRLGASPVTYRMRPPDLGADSERIRRWLMSLSAPQPEGTS